MSTEGRRPPAADGPSEDRRTTGRNSVGSVRDVSSFPPAFGDGKIKLFTGLKSSTIMNKPLIINEGGLMMKKQILEIPGKGKSIISEGNLKNSGRLPKKHIEKVTDKLPIPSFETNASEVMKELDVDAFKDIWILHKSINNWPTYVIPVEDGQFMVEAFISKGKWDANNLKKVFGKKLVDMIMKIQISKDKIVDSLVLINQNFGKSNPGLIRKVQNSGLVADMSRDKALEPLLKTSKEDRTGTFRPFQKFPQASVDVRRFPSIGTASCIRSDDKRMPSKIVVKKKDT
ncbi:hypothetical protein MA16_Dca000764 [Dendrobium catenatum]|uniref:Uncharacterized protein n=1 Tax=Dendrobium catenatum TaxID=906689 RepID=A0A2I0WUS5_9ASPA|nr:hypothetical protein MA16_Dca000764 [Dendrobium catenatum]